MQPGDAIILLESSGIHANGLTLARKLAERSENGYAVPIAGGRMYGDALLDPTIIYSSVTEALFEAGVAVRYLANITGHGWRKLMRHPGMFTYCITRIPPVPPVLQFMAEQAGLDAGEAYGSLNMGAGFAVFVPERDAPKTVEVSGRLGIKAYRAGSIDTGKKRVIIEPLNIAFEGESLDLRA
jgi:phosphoribosylformylglycinamidine cyclo-ligase